MIGKAFRLIDHNAFGLDEANQVALLSLSLLKNGQSLFRVFKIPNIHAHFLLLIVPSNELISSF
jgi:hypothetical protein